MRPQRQRISLQMGLAVAVALSFGARCASADFVFDLDNPNSAISPYTGPFGKVDVHLVNSTTATVTLDSLTNGGNIYLFGSQNTLALNVNSNTFTVSGIAGSNSGTGFTQNQPSDFTANLGLQTVGGHGKFNLAIDTFDGFGHSMNHLTLTLTDVSGTWASANDVLQLNDNGSLAAGHVFVTSSSADFSNGALATGFAGGPAVSTAPAPSSAILLGCGALTLLGFTALSRLRRQPA